MGRLRLHVESFRQAKNSSGTQTDLTVMRAEQQKQAGSQQTEGKYTGQFKKHHTAPPSKPVRKTKPSGSQSSTPQRRSSSGSNPDCSSSRSDRSASPDNSSTSGYSSPSAGIHSKENSPYGSKIDEKIGEGGDTARVREEEREVVERVGGGHHEEEEEYMEEDGSKITVIQIVPASMGSGSSPVTPQNEVARTGNRSSSMETTGERHHSLDGPNSSGSYEEEVMASAVEEMEFRRRGGQHQQQQQQQRKQSPPHRELPIPRINPHSFNRPVSQTKRKLPEPVPNRHQQQIQQQLQQQQQQYEEQQRQEQQRQEQQQNVAPPPNPANQPQRATGYVSENTKRLYRSNLPRPSPMNQFAQGRVPLPPVPELERSDHERESISPIPTPNEQKIRYSLAILSPHPFKKM